MVRRRLFRRVLSMVCATSAVAGVGVVALDAAPPAAAAVSYASYAGSRYDWSVYRPGTHWVCGLSRVNVYLNPAHAKPGSAFEVRAAVQRLAWATHIPFVYAGTTTLTRRLPSYTVVVNYFTPSQLLADGQPTSVFGYAAHDNVRGRITRGWVVVNAAYANAYSLSWQLNVLMHELGHVVNLGHAVSTSQIMHFDASWAPYGLWGRGDLAGLRAMGC